MKVSKLIEELCTMPPEADVLFDTEAAQFHLHMVSVDSAFYEEEPHPHVGLHTKDPREYTGARDRKLAAMVAELAEIKTFMRERARMKGFTVGHGDFIQMCTVCDADDRGTPHRPWCPLYVNSSNHTEKKP